jgi:hypothetical protein
MCGMSGEHLPFKVVRTNGSDEVIARTADLRVGRAAFERAAALRPKDVIEFRNGAMVIGRSEPGKEVV